MSEIDINKYFKVFDDGREYFMECMIDELYEDIVNQNKHIQQLQIENEELQEMNNNLSEKFANVCGGCFEQELREKYEQCLDEIEGICKENYYDDSWARLTLKLDAIIQKIKEVKEGN